MALNNNVGVLGVLKTTKSFLESVVALCHHYKIDQVRLFKGDVDIFNAFRGSGIGLSFGISTEIATNPSALQNWFNDFLKPYINEINFNYIFVGIDINDELLPAMQAVQDLLNAHTLVQIKVTTMISYHSSLFIKDLPSRGTFYPNIAEHLKPVINFLAQQGSPLMVHLYPYLEYIQNDSISTEFATFTATEPVRDGQVSYYNLFDMMVDTVASALDKLRVADVDIMIGETGWPTVGEKATVALAAQYNKKLLDHVNSGKGTPTRPNIVLRGFIRSLFNEREGQFRYFGIFNDDFSPVYPLF